MDAATQVTPPVLPRWLTRALVLIGIWSVPGVLLAMSTYVSYALKGGDLSIAEALLWRWPEWMVWALATPLIVWLSRRWPVWRAPWKTVPIHLVACTAVGCADIIVYWTSGYLLGEQPFTTTPLSEMLPWMLLKTGFFEMLVYGAIVAVDQAIAYNRRYREAAMRQSQLEARLVEAQLDALKHQLQPHFLFNTINAISVLMRKGENAAAVRMLGGLGELLRRSLSSLRVELATLDEELDFIQRYLDIETTRFPDRLRVTLDIEPDARRAYVPTLILQPIVENAIEHGIAQRVSGGRITIAAVVDGEWLRIIVSDDGAGLVDEPRAKGHGVGLDHVRKRVAQLYPGRHRFTLEPNEPSGAKAILEIPYVPRGAGDHDDITEDELA